MDQITTVPLFQRYVPWLFHKLKGKEYAEALMEARKVYGTDEQSPVERYKFLHVTVHSLPVQGEHNHNRWLKLLTLWAAAAVWVLLFPLDLKIRTLVAASAYTLTESTFTYLERGIAFTSFCQFYCNLLYVPILLDLYGQLMEDKPLLYIACFPLNIYMLEIVVGYYCRWLYGFNAAWCYADYDDAYFDGCIRLAHAPFWIGLGCCTVIAYPLLTTWTTQVCAGVDMDMAQGALSLLLSLKFGPVAL